MAILIIGEPFNKNKRKYVKAKCECGKEFDTRLDGSRKIKSCGCLKRCPTPVRKHGHTVGKPTPEYNAWQGMKERCCNPNSAFYYNYGGRGIQVCDRWKNSFKLFLADIGTRPEGMSIDRIDNNGNYEPGHVRWATAKEQSRNRRSNCLVIANGVERLIFDIADETGIPATVIKKRLKRGWAIERAISEPPQDFSERSLTVYGKTMLMCEWMKISGDTRKNISTRLERGWSDKQAIFGKLKT